MNDEVFSNNELRLLELGLTYALDKGLNRLSAFIDPERFVRNHNIKKHFAEKPPQGTVNGEPNEYINSGLKKRSIFNFYI